MTDRAEWWAELVSSIHSRMAFRMRADYRLRLEHPGWDHRTVANIARSSGFSNASTFSNAYRERFGERPTDTRERCRAHHASRSLPGEEGGVTTP